LLRLKWISNSGITRHYPCQQPRLTLRRYPINPKDLIFQWTNDFEAVRWRLTIYPGGLSRQLQFLERDVEGWSPTIAGNYRGALLEIIDWFMKKRP
jgi:hypothetical protein